MEKWKPIPNYEGYYEASTQGRIRSVDKLVKSAIKNNSKVFRKGKILKLAPKKNGYLSVDLSVEGKKKTKSVHRLVALTFLQDINETVNHKNGNKTDNRLENLEWCTRSENVKHCYDVLKVKNANMKKIQCVENGMIFESSTKAAEWLNKTKYMNSKNINSIARNIRAVCTGKRKRTNGYRWKDLV